MKAIIAGGRDYYVQVERDVLRLDALHDQYGITEVVSGGATGADMFGEGWAASRNLPVKKFSVTRDQWILYGPSAGPRRNAAMAQYAEDDGILIAFPGGKGTANMIKQAEKHNIPVVRIE